MDLYMNFDIFCLKSQKVKMCYINGYNSTDFYTITHDIYKIYYHWAQT